MLFVFQSIGLDHQSNYFIPLSFVIANLICCKMEKMEVYLFFCGNIRFSEIDLTYLYTELYFEYVVFK